MPLLTNQLLAGAKCVYMWGDWLTKEITLQLVDIIKHLTNNLIS